MSNYTTINIEKSILSSILFDANIINDIASLLQPADFSYEPHKHIYATMQQLHNDDYPIDETMIMQKNKSINHGVLVDILTANPVSNILSYVKELKKDAIQRQIHLITLSLSQNFDVKLIDKLQNLKNELENVDIVKKLQPFSSLKQKLIKYNLNYEEIENLKFDYIYPNFLVAGEVTFVAAPPSNGKSLTMFELCFDAVVNKHLAENLVYLDADNSKTTIQQRKIHEKVVKNQDKITYVVSKKRTEINDLLKDLLKSDLKNTIVVFDSIKNFFDGLDRDKNKDVSKVLDMLKTLRDNGATVIFLHHTNKPKHDIDQITYAGSSAFLEDTSNAYILKHNKDKNTFVFNCIKNRVGEIEDKAFLYDFSKNTICEVNLEEAKQTKEDEEMIQETIEFISNSRKEPTWSEIYNNLLELGFEKNKASKIIKEGENKIWVAKRGERNNQKLYSLIETDTKPSKPVEIVFETQIEKITSGTPISSGSPFYGGFGVSSTINSNTDNSDNSKTMSNFCEFDKIEMPIAI